MRGLVDQTNRYTYTYVSTCRWAALQGKPYTYVFKHFEVSRSIYTYTYVYVRGTCTYVYTYVCFMLAEVMNHEWLKIAECLRGLFGGLG